MIIEDKTAAEIRCPACNAVIEIDPVMALDHGAEIVGQAWTGDLRVKHASPSCDWSRRGAMVTAWIRDVLASALRKGAAS